jgi:hypothetical protein
MSTTPASTLYDFIEPWDAARYHAEQLKRDVTECGWRHGSCHSDFDETGHKWAALIDLTAQIIAGLDELTEEKKSAAAVETAAL